MNVFDNATRWDEIRRLCKRNGWQDLPFLATASAGVSLRPRCLAGEGLRIVGDSRVLMGDWKALLPDVSGRIINCGVGGSGVEHWIDRDRRYLDYFCRGYSQERILLAIGGNDLSRDPGDIIWDYNLLIDKIRERTNAKIFIHCVLPVLNGHPETNMKIEIFNTRLLNLSRERSCFFINCSPLFYRDRLPIPEYYIYDGVHFNDYGYAVWGRYLNWYFSLRWSRPSAIMTDSLKEAI